MDGALALAVAEPAPAAPRAQADEALRMAQAQLHGGRERALRALALARERGDDVAAAVAEHALGLVDTELGDLRPAGRHLRRAIRLAERAQEDALAAEAHLSLALVLAWQGQGDRALAEVDAARHGLRGAAAAHADTRRALVLQRAGRLDEALEVYRDALSTLRRHGDRLWEARLLCNRGVLHAYRGSLRAAESDLTRAERLHGELGQHLAATQVRHNLGFVAARRGDIPAALAWYDRVDAEYRELDVPRGLLQLDRCQALLAAGLAHEARAAAEQAVDELARGHMRSDLAEARLLLAQAATLAGDHRTGAREAECARRAFLRQGRDAWAVLARYAELRAAWLGGEHTRARLDGARRTSLALAAAGWADAALDARIIAGRIALALGDGGVARRELSSAARSRRRGTVAVRVGAWHADALLRASVGDRRGARAALGAGRRVLEAHRLTLGATELRARASAQASELACLDVELALQTRRPRAILAAAERWRASSLRLAPIRPPDDAVLAAELAELRRVSAAIDDAALEGRPTDALIRRQAALERAVRERCRHARGGRARVGDRALTVDRLVPALDERALVELVQVRGVLHAVTLAGGRARLTELGPLARVEHELATLSAALRRMTLGHGSTAARTATPWLVREVAAQLDALLLAPLAGALDGRDLVVVPTGTLHAVPWGLLPNGRRRTVTVAASATLWHDLQRRAGGAPAAGEVALVAGPDLPHAAAEVRLLRDRYPAAACLAGPSATVQAVLRALESARCAHLAAHGCFRAESPLFSALRLADGPLTVYDLEALRQAPELIVLSACDSGLSAVTPGDELMGLSAALFAVGARTLVASVMPVRDEATRTLMVALHARLAEGLPPARALAAAQADTSVEDGLTAAFVCFGAG